MIEYKLSDILQIADKGFKTLFGGFDFWCTSELIKVQQIGKNSYLELVEYDAGGKVKAKAKACIFDDTISKTFLKNTKLQTLSELTGAKILFHGYFSFHQEYGFSIIITELSAEFTIGQLQKKQDDILLELQKLGIAYNNKLLQPGFPSYTVAIISSQTAAGLKDFQTVMKHSGYVIQYENYFCAIHGNNAMDEVHAQLQAIYADIKAGKKIDAVAIIRGGGESSGMIWQNDLNIAKGICLMPVPVIVAIGHTPDKSILQDIARYGAKTPTDGAYKIIELMQRWENHIAVMYQQISEEITAKKGEITNNVDLWHKNISQKLSRFLQDTRFHINAWYGTIMATSPEKMLQSGYALLLNDGEYMTKGDINTLKTGDKVELKVYDKTFVVEIKESK